MRMIFLAVLGAAYGLLAAAGVFTVLVAVGLVPRFAGKTHTAEKIVLYEETVILGTVFGCAISVFARYCQIGSFLKELFPQQTGIIMAAGNIFEALFGIFAGMFIGCLALAIAEMLDSIPIFARRISFRHGLGFAILGMSAGKICGSLIYFWAGLYGSAQ